jgi:drug/metabolite transporter (DMT)-like permease
VLFRVLSPPGVHTDLVALSPSWGSWVALAAAVAIAGGGVWTPAVGRSDRSGVTPEHWPI